VLGESLYSSSAYFLFSGSAHGFRVFLRVYSLSLAAHPAALAGFAAFFKGGICIPTRALFRGLLACRKTSTCRSYYHPHGCYSANI